MSRPLRILVVIDSLEIAGPARLVVSSAIGLAQRGLDVRVAHLGIGDARLMDNELRARRVPVLDLRLGSLLDPRSIMRLSRYIKRHAIDVVHTHNPYAHLVGRPAARLAGRPAVSTVHSIVDIESGWRHAVRRRLDYLSARHLCRLVITVSEAQRRVYVRNARVQPKRVERLRNGVDTSLFRSDAAARSRIRGELGLTPHQPLFVTVSALRPGKGLEDLVVSVPNVRRQLPAARFAIAGDGPLHGALASKIHAAGLSDSVQLLGLRQDVAAVLAAGDVCVHPSHFEALPTSILEAMAVGLPVVACDVGGIPEIVIHGQTGALVTPGCPDSLAAAMVRIGAQATRHELGAAARAWVERNASLDRWLDGLLAIYERAGWN
jgi:glycosyltransferase involved in cell wall biosynthesis